MSKLNTVIFVDGQNFKKSLQEYRFGTNFHKPTDDKSFDREFKLDEKHFLWGDFFRDVILKFSQLTGDQYRLIRAYWYNAEVVSPWYVDTRQVQYLMDRYRDRMPELTEQAIIDLARTWYDRNKENFLEGRNKVYEVIQKDVDFIEFKYVGQYRLRPFDVFRFEKNPVDGSYTYFGTREGEKGVDIGIAIDMISKMAGYDVAILISGDADFFPAIRYLKDELKQVFQFSVVRGMAPNVRYLSPIFKSIVDVTAYFDEYEMLSMYLNRNSGIPAVILKTIDERIDRLKNKTYSGEQMML